MQIEGMFMYSSELSEPDFTKSPKVFNPVDMTVSGGEFVVAMFDSIVLFITKISQSVVGFKPIGIYDRCRIRFSPDNRHKFEPQSSF